MLKKFIEFLKKRYTWGDNEYINWDNIRGDIALLWLIIVGAIVLYIGGCLLVCSATARVIAIVLFAGIMTVWALGTLTEM